MIIDLLTKQNPEMLSHLKIKESYKSYNNDKLEGIKVTPDNKMFIEEEVERFFEKKPEI